MAVTILPKDFDLGAALGKGAGEGLSESVRSFYQKQEEKEKEDKLTKALSNLSDEDLQDPRKLYGALSGRPEIAKAISDQQTNQQTARLKEAQTKQKEANDKEVELRDYETIKNYFGEDFANTYRTASVGGKTELLKSGVEALQRGNKVEDIFKGPDTEKTDENQPSIPENIPQIKDSKLPTDFKYPDFSKKPSGATPKEWRDEKNDWRKENVPIFKENERKLANTKRDQLSTKTLTKLDESKKLPEDFSRLIIDPETGDIRTSAQLFGLASPEAQQWVKEIARFLNRAKDAYGSRVTNFELESYMKQFPNLLNTHEGRSRILKMMTINYKLDELYQNALDKTYKKYGLGNIPQESADELAQAFIKDERKNLEDQYLRVSEGIEYVSELDNKGYVEGDTARDPNTNENFYYNGSEWVKVE